MSDQNRKRLLLASGFFVLAIGLAAARAGLSLETAGLRLGAVFVMHDFYATAYYPVRAFIEGQSPYDVGYAPFAPIHLLIHLPFGLLPPRAAGVAYFLFTALLAVPLAHLVLRLVRVEPQPPRVLALAAAILLSRPGHWTLLVGQLAILLSALAYAAFLHGAARPTLAAWALSGALFKPNWGVPLALLLWAWGRRKTTALGIALAAVLNLPLIAVLVVREGGLHQFLGGVLSAYRGFEQLVDPLAAKGRTDATSLISRFVGAPLSQLEQILLAAGILLLSAAILRLLAKHSTPAAEAVAIGIICLATSLVGYHQGYDLVLLSAPFLAAALPSSSSGMPRGFRLAVVSLFSVLALNWVSTESVIAALRPSPALMLVITSVNGFCVAALFLAYIALGVRYHIQSTGRPGSVEPQVPGS